jgi:multiple antibiotic resistance protein
MSHEPVSGIVGGLVGEGCKQLDGNGDAGMAGIGAQGAAQELLLAFVTLFVAVDILGLLPLYLSLTENLPPDVRRRLPLHSTVTATAVAVGFLLLGDWLFRLMGVSVGDFQVAGGILLVVLSIQDMLSPVKERRRLSPTLGVVPLGTPLIVGPAVLATLLVLVQQDGYAVTLVALAANMLAAYVGLTHADRAGRLLGTAGSEAIAKVASLFLAAFGVSLVRRGVQSFLPR